ncbi:conserved hypothetical protein [Leishmania major strain Friedlin]|uniref:Uncharacterized protein n=1 Tax=Leishmania major TaxID=5664 RepID=Q4Q1Q0_LEIMA|nr:conserved hypothetical protein [Leishmania major strain Friedlin]CAG9583696.1 hypothetical_protein_-_conserved [Leishmania major strain Friedlin]CAJ09129.1 conserved hypothetical protein [Leishmania major strain Friedlin]|eukprot:XP_001686748.1 conserved hypothetical protein [Leishmania major strain Friedlin]
MNRSSVRLFGNYSRTSGAQQHSQAAHTSSLSSTRSSSVLGSLVRMRNQFHRLRHAQQQQAIAAVLARYRLQPALRTPAASTSRAAGQIDGDDSVGQEGSGEAGGSAASSVLQTAIILCTEALRLLNGEVRCRDNLSDVPKSSPMYGSEVGKLLNIAAAFGASTTFPRVQHALHWIKLNKESLHTPRQVMSLCMPLLSLADGRTAGVAFVLEELYEPLLLALQDVASTSPESAAESADNAPSDATAAVQQHLVAITSAMGMVAKWSSLRLGSKSKGSLSSSPSEVLAAAKSDATAEELDKMLRIAETCAAALRRQSDRCRGTGPDEAFVAMAHLSPSDVLQWIQCLHGLEKMYALVAPTLGVSRAQAEAASRRLLLCYRALLPLTQRTLELPGGGGGATVAAASSATFATGATATSVRVADVVELIQAGLQTSIEPTHVDLALSYGLQALPGALASATVKDLSDAAQVVNKVRQKRPSALPAPLLLSIQAAFRPALFLLRETHALQFRASDCGVLLSSLSRWEEVPGVTVSADIVELLSQRFVEQMHVVGASHLVPFVASLARFEERKRPPQRGGAAGQAVKNAAVLGEDLAGESAQLAYSGVAWKTSEGRADRLTSPPVLGARTRGAEGVRYRFCTTSRVVSQCVQRAIVLAGDTETPGDPAAPPRLSTADAAQLLTYFVQLSAPQCADFFNKVEPLLAPAIHGSAATPSPASAAIRLRVVTGDAVQRFVRYAAEQREHTWAQCTNPTAQETRKEASVVEVRRATALLRGMSRGLTKLVREAASPKDLVLVCSLLRRRLLDKGAAAGVAVEGGEGALKKLKSAKPTTAVARARTRAWTRKELELATVFAAQASKMAPECKGVELGALASVTSSLCTAGVLPHPVAQQFMRAVWARCAAGLAVASRGEAVGPEAAAALTLSLENCKTIMDASRSAHLTRTVPPVIFLEAFAAQCSELLEESSGAAGGEGSPSTARGTARAYAEAVTKLRRTADLGRSLVSYFGSLRPSRGAAEGDAAMESTTWREAQVSALESYLEVAHSVVEAYATEATLSETWWAELDGGNPPPMPLELLSTTANVMAQIYRLVHRGVGSTKRVSSIPATAPTVPDEVPDAEGDVLDGSLTAVDGAGVAVRSELESKALEDDVEPSPLLYHSPANLSTVTLDQAVRDTLGLLGDTIVALARQQQQQLSSSVSANVSGETATEDYGRLTTAPGHALVQNPKHLLMLLRAFETVEHPHPEMLYSVLPELRGCADRLDPLELSLLIRALTQLGAWNSRLLSALATAVASKMNQCKLRQCYTLLHGLCWSGCTSPDTYVELRSTPRRDGDSGRGGAANKAAAQEPLQRLAESTLLRLDAFVRTKDAFMSLARTAAVADLVGVVKVLRFFHAPPAATYDAFVVLAVRRLASQAKRLSLGTVVQHTMVLLNAVSELRQPEQQRVSAQALWTVLRRAFASSTEAGSPGALTAAAGDAFGGVLHLPACWELTRFAALHSLQYGREATRDFFVPIVASTTEQRAVSCARLTQTRLARFIETHASDLAADARSPLPFLTAAERAALRRYALHASPCLVRGDRELDAYMCAPLKLARLIADGDPTTLVHAATTAAPAAQARRCIRLLACLLRTDLWPPSISAATADTQMLVAALLRLWTAAELDGLLRHSPGAFSTEELLVLAAAADRVHQYSMDAGNLQDDFAVAVRQLCAATTEWRLPAAVDAWMLFAMPFMASSSIPAAALPNDSDELFVMLVASGDVLVTRFAHAQQSWTTSGARMLPELLRLFRGPGQLDVAMLQSRAVGVDTLSSALPHPAADAPAARVRFVEIYRELLRCFTVCLT